MTLLKHCVGCGQLFPAKPDEYRFALRLYCSDICKDAQKIKRDATRYKQRENQRKTVRTSRLSKLLSAPWKSDIR